mgnify:FL=1
MPAGGWKSPHPLFRRVRWAHSFRLRGRLGLGNLHPSIPIRPMNAFYLKAIGLDQGVLRSLEWLEGELAGDEDLIERFHFAREAIDTEALLWTHAPKDIDSFEGRLAEAALRSLFDPLVDFESGFLSPMNDLEAEAVKHNAKSSGRKITAGELDREQRERHRQRHFTPPFGWSEIEAVLADLRDAPDGHPKPGEILRCLQCFQPMEWIWFRSSAATSQMLCGREGWTPICRACRTWRACRIGILS